MAILDIGKKLTVILQYLPAAVAFGFSLSCWIEGWIQSALMMGLIGIGLTLLTVYLNAIRKIPGNENRYVIVVAVMIFCGSLYMLITGDIYISIILILIGIFFIFAHFLHLQKNAGSKWSTPIWQIYIPIGASLITFGPLFYLEISSDKYKSHTVGKESGVQRMTVDKSSILNRGSKRKASTSASPSVKKAVNLMTQFFTPDQAKDPTVQKLMKIVESESFQEQLERQNPKTLDDMLQLLVAHGLTEAGEIDVADIIAQHQRSLEAEYKAKNPNQAPEEKDDEMAERFAVAINGGPNGGMVFATNRENAEWMMLRFNEDPEAYREWINLVRRHVESGEAFDVSPTSELRNVTNPSPSTENEPTDFVTESEPTEAWEESTISNTEARRERTTPLVETEKVISNVSPVAPSLPADAELAPTLREQFSVEDIERARSAPEEKDLNDVRKDDPEGAEPVEQDFSKEEDPR